MYLDKCTKISLVIFGLLFLGGNIFMSLLFSIETECINTNLFTYQSTSFYCSNEVCDEYNRTYISYIIKWNKCLKKNETYTKTSQVNDLINEIQKTNNTYCYYILISPCKYIDYSKSILPPIMIVIIDITIIVFVYFLLRTQWKYNKELQLEESITNNGKN